MMKMVPAVLIAAVFAAPAPGGDWPQWRGAQQTGASGASAPVTSWTKEGENLLWKSDIGGRTAPIVMRDRVYVITPVGEGVSLRERVVCLDATDGKTLWEYGFPVFHTDIVENRVGFTALAGDEDTGNVYAHGTGGELICFDRDGKIVWKHSLAEEFGRISGYGGRLHTPIIDENRVVISFTCSGWGEYAKPAHRYYAFDKKTGAAIWSASPGGPPSDTSCACPVVAVIGGQRLLICPNVDGAIYALLARTGETVWSFKVSPRPLNTMPVVAGSRIYFTHSEENLDTTEMGAAFCIDGGGRGELDRSAVRWRVNGLEAGYAAPALANGRLYVVDNSANLFALDADDGRVAWRQKIGNLGKGAPVVTSDGVIYVGSQEEHGLFWILRDAGDKCEVLDQKEFPRTPLGLDEMLGSAALADGRVFFQTRYATYCLGHKGAQLGGGLQATLPEDKPTDGEQPVLTLVEPHEITLAPGESFTPVPRAYSAAGRLINVNTFAPPVYSVTGVRGAIDAGKGVFTAGKESVFSAGVVKTKWIGEKEAITRVRICPKPPFKVDFEDMKPDSVPPGWLNVINKTKVIEKDGSKVLQKLAERPSPPFMRIRAFMTPPIAAGYTISADMIGGVRKTPLKEFWPEMGLVNARYELVLLGDEATQPRLRLVTWAPIPRLQKDVPFDWKPGVWYRMKFEVKLEGDKSVLRGKVWAREQAEPSAWTIEATDPFPNREGSPGLYAYSNGTTEKSKGAEVFFDNVAVE